MVQFERTALHVAAQRNALEVATLLLNVGAEIDATDQVRAGC